MVSQQLQSTSQIPWALDRSSPLVNTERPLYSSTPVPHFMPHNNLVLVWYWREEGRSINPLGGTLL